MRVKVALGAGLTAYDLDLIQIGHPGPGSQVFQRLSGRREIPKINICTLYVRNRDLLGGKLHPSNSLRASSAGKVVYAVD
jgi:hypothetical protein